MRVTNRETNEQNINSGWLIALAVLTIVLGMVTIAYPLFATIVSTLVFGWVFVIAGITQIVYAFQSKGAGQIFGKLILGLLYLLAGIFVLANPLVGSLSLTVVIGVTIFVQGIIQTSMAFQLRRSSPNWGWMLASGIAGIILGILIGSNIPATAPWLLGTLVGINLLFDGVWMLTLPSERALHGNNL
jgi:uncharacterized membrane protein HdeD (DUF308 family)